MLNSMTRWNPSSNVSRRDPFYRMMDSFFGENALSQSEDVSNRAWLPAVNIRENDDAFLIEAELPGMTKDDIDITLENNLLKLSGERRFEKDNSENGNYHRIERSYGSFLRTFSLPSQVDSEKVEARFENGVLTVAVPKTTEAKPRKISIS